MRKSADQDVQSTVRYEKPVTVELLKQVDDLSLVRWNSNNVKDLLDDVVLNGPDSRAVTATKTLYGSLLLNNLHVSGKIDGCPVSSLVKTNDAVLPANTSFAAITIKKELAVGGLIDGVNVTDLLRRRVSLSDESTVEGNFTFLKTVDVGDVYLDRINDVDVNNLVLKTAAPNQVVSGTKFLRNGVTFQVR